MAYAVQATTHYQTYPREASRSQSAPEKSVQFGPDGGSLASNTSITRGPPVVAVAVSLDPILPHR